MKLKRIISLLLILAILFVTSGCSMNFFSIDTLLKPPALSGKSGEVQEAFNKLMSGKTFLLKTPTKGEYKSSFVLYDIDGDDNEEALVFYTDSSTDTTVRMSVLDCVNDTWVLATDIKGSGSGVYDVTFPDLDGDRVPEIVVSWSLFDDNSTKMATVFKTAVGTNKVLSLNTLANEYFSEKSYVDLNSNGVEDLVLIYLDDSGEVQNSYFRAFSLQNSSSLIKFSELKLDSSITAISKINSDKITSGKNEYSRIFIDCVKSDTSIFTEVVAWDFSKLKAVRCIINPAKNTLRSSKVLSFDIDDDGDFEIPVISSFFTEEKTATVVISGATFNFTMLEWLNVTGDNRDITIKTLYNPIHSFLFEFPWGEKVTVNFDKIENQTNFCIWNSTTKEIEDILFSIKFIENAPQAKSSNVESYDDHFVLYETDLGVFVYEITAYGEDFGITEDIIRSSFIIV